MRLAELNLHCKNGFEDRGWVEMLDPRGRNLVGNS